jgi:ATP-dependent 26S proteasome regulatory subunit
MASGGTKLGRNLGAMRIEAGAHKGTRLAVPDGIDVRPTSDRARQAIFNMLIHRFDAVEGASVIDAFAGSRDKGDMPEYTRRILSVMLRQMQGLVDTSGVVVIGATNRKEDLDPALLSRFTRSIYFPLPNEAERAAIIGYDSKHLSEGEPAGLGRES